ncbi:MAG: 2Fe-2S iron-sulfur cluster binding domain-containing protein, partial [Alphaproteobacteria bacterium]|nr:2Fe-2S iron-sulfur cluster binding domain-containing protein [Alphaproteobacteria bacterium]
MTAVRRELRFLVNDEEVALGDAGASDSLLDFLRLRRGLRGTKEGCAEGDCGACTVLVGRLRDGDLRYEAVNSCIRLLPSLDGCHVVTVEHLAGADGGLHPVQQAMVDCHGSQCGFCTPGIVMVLYALWLERPRPSEAEVRRALQGNLCRCTGYAPILRAGAVAADYGLPEDDGLVRSREAVAARLAAMVDGKRVELAGGSVVVPVDEDDLADALESEPAA